ncbi:hypothetical protein [Flavobacterium terrisoli]|uniref:hypothetical protein n=1 Tax=Flavobacterium terrisoli TaxID=3242195 RepID=UPI002542D4D4|nr:hypothetical protein [Flavobacterium buctense]
MKNFLNYILTIIPVLFISTGCSNIDYQKIVINNHKKTIKLLNPNFVIDSISISKFGKSKLSISLQNKLQGNSFLDITQPNLAYKVYADKFDYLSCDDPNLTLRIIIRQKGKDVKLTENVANNFETNPYIQTLYIKYLPCSKEVDTFETDGHLK